MAMVSLRQIAQRAGCSRSAVSYALRNQTNISKELRERIQRIADEMGWRPDPRLAAQMSLTRQVVTAKDVPPLAIVIQKSSRQLEREPAPRLQLAGAVEYVSRMGFIADVFNLGDQPLRVERLRGILLARGIQGVIFVATLSPSLPKAYLEMGVEFASVVVGTPIMTLPFHCVNNDILRAGRLSLRTLREKGYARIGVILPHGVDAPLGYSYTAGFSAGYAAMPAELRIPILNVGDNQSHIDPIYHDNICDWLRTFRPEAVVTTDASAIHAMQAASSSARTPEWKFDLFSADLAPGQPVLGGIDMRQKSLGEAAVDVVVAQIHRGAYGIPKNPRAIFVRPVWVDGSDYDPNSLSNIS